MNQIEAMKQALEELSWHRFSRAEGILRTAIEQALTPGEPVAWMHTGGHVHVRNPQWPPKTAALYTAEKGWTPLYTAPQPQPKQEPREHITDGSPCWCNPEVDYIDPETGAAVIVHRRPQ